ncbi:hypothetical protein B0H17DRAFT_1200206 [Mycena rosella]|uniref:Uncharacterized protein n=1 Tax=Mycena rosella TaxID=1033263 RepID=A0AAD7GIS2_MYCRO|nr:hypothetical protein B0H17DRAFT_1200206 [Mycena rosella]
MFELGKCNMAGTAYKVCKHITKALQACSKAVKTVIERYNVGTNSMIPPKVNLAWETVVEYKFLSNFRLTVQGAGGYLG